MDSLSIRKIIDKISSGEIRIPSFQRGFVWEPDAVAFFMDSLYKGYPIGAILLWRTREKLVNERNLGRFILPDPVKDYPIDYVLDGQQRLTSIFSVFQTDLIPEDDPNWCDIYYIIGSDKNPQDQQFVPLDKSEVDLSKHFPISTLFDSVKYRKATESLSDETKAEIDKLQETFKEVNIPAQSMETDDIWFPYIPFGKLTIIQGNPGEGKTYFAMRLAAACTNRKPLPGMETLEPFNIIYQTAEDGLGDTVKPRLMEAEADLERVLVIDDRDTPLTLADERIARAIRENNARLVIIDPVQAFLGADVDMNRANEVRPIFRSLGDIAQATGCAIVLIGHLNKAAGTQSTYRGLGSIDITAAVRSLLFIGKLKDSPTTRVLIHEKSSLAPPGQSLAFSLGDEKGFEWIGAYDITADELLAGTDTAKTESKTAQAQMLILELLADGKKMPSAELEKTVNERGISSRTMRTAKSRIGDRLVTEKDGTAWVCYLRN